MITIKVLGTGCAKCKATVDVIQGVLAATGTEAEVEKIEDLPSIMKYGVMATPAVVVDGNVVHAGGIPARAQVQEWLAA